MYRYECTNRIARERQQSHLLNNRSETCRLTMRLAPRMPRGDQGVSVCRWFQNGHFWDKKFTKNSVCGSGPKRTPR
uniref:Uncharacterized protein n=1 Tax=Steinernema glaseri TaxID=37863 RepID=A0A1I8AIH4_9BILA